MAEKIDKTHFMTVFVKCFKPYHDLQFSSSIAGISLQNWPKLTEKYMSSFF